MVAQAWGKGDAEWLFNEDTASVWEEEKFLEMDGGDGCTTV